jgi:hypothetical protein
MSAITPKADIVDTTMRFFALNAGLGRDKKIKASEANSQNNKMAAVQSKSNKPPASIVSPREDSGWYWF